MTASVLPKPLQDKKGWPWSEYVDAEIYTRLPRLPKVSVIVPSYNQGQYLEECLRSILAQNYTNLEILVADGGSKDVSTQVLAHYAPYLTWYVSEKDRGTWHADNKALAQATGEFVLVVNSDDYLLKNGLYHLLATILAQDGQAWSTGRVRAVNQVGEAKAVFTPKPSPAAQPGRTLLYECWIYHPATLIRRDLIGRFAETDLMDWELWIRLEKVGYLPAITTATVAALRFHSDCKSFDTVSMYRSQLRLMDTLAENYPDRLLTERRHAKRRMAEAQMIADAEQGRKASAVGRWLNTGVRNPSLLTDRAYIGLGRRLALGNLGDLYRPMAFLDQTYTPSSEDECAL